MIPCAVSNVGDLLVRAPPARHSADSVPFRPAGT